MSRKGKSSNIGALILLSLLALGFGGAGACSTVVGLGALNQKPSGPEVQRYQTGEIGGIAILFAFFCLIVFGIVVHLAISSFRASRDEESEDR